MQTRNVATGEGHLCLAAVQAERLDLVCLLIGSHANVNVRCQGKTPLYVACEQGHEDIVKALLEAGADKTIKCFGLTALEIAQAQRREDIVRLLKKRWSKRR